MDYSICRKSLTSQFIQIQFSLECSEKELIQLQLPAWRPGRYELANYGQKLKGFKVTTNGSEISWKKISKDLWGFIACYPGIYLIEYEFYCNQMDAGGCWSDDQQLYLNFSNFIFEVLQRKNEGISLSIELPKDFQVASALKETKNNTWMAESFQHLMDSPFLASPDLKHFPYSVNGTTFHIWIQGEIHFYIESLIEIFRSFTVRQIKDFGEFPAEDYHFIFQLLPHKHYHGVEHAFSTVITYGPAHALSEKSELDQLIGVSSHELYHFWNVCRIRPKGLLPYDLSKEVYLNEGLVMEGVTTYMGDYYLLQSGYFSVQDYLKVLEEQIQKEFDSFGWQNQSIVESSFDLWLDGYKPGIPDKKVSIYNRGALISLCIDLMLKSSGSSLSIVMKGMWENYGKTGVGYELREFEKMVISLSKDQEKMESFFQCFVFGKKDLLPVLKNLLNQIGLVIHENYEENDLLHHCGIRINEAGIITQIHPDSDAYFFLMKNDRILESHFGSETPSPHPLKNQVRLEIERLGKIIQIKFRKSPKKYFPKFSILTQHNHEHVLNGLLGTGNPLQQT